MQQIDGLKQKGRNSIANALELRFFLHLAIGIIPHAAVLKYGVDKQITFLQ